MDKIGIRSIRARGVLAPFKRPLHSASGQMAQAALVLVDLETDAGVTGRSYLFAFSPGMLKPIVGCIETLDELLRGDALAPLDIERKVRKQFVLFDTPGILGLAISGVDMCAWDALARVRGVPLAQLLGGSMQPIRAYNSCGLWMQPIEKLGDDAESLLAEGGFSAVKLRIGRDDPRQDLAAVEAVMKRVGGTAHVMSDFNQRLTVNEAIERGRMLDDQGLYWIEEPVRHDNYAGYAQICAELQTPIQTGENLLDSFAMVEAIQAQSLDYVMPDIQRIGGVSGWLRAAALAHAHGIEMSSHLFPEYSAHMLAVTPTRHWLEYMDWSTAILAQPYEVKAGHVVIPDRPGTGIEWDEAAVARYRVA